MVELSIVLAILGLLVGGVLAGRSLIRAAELRSVVTDASSYLTAVSNFRNQYRYLPGDLPTATSYWSAATNGDGDGLIADDERYGLWQQLYLAGFVPTAYTGATGSGGANDFVLGSNIPKSRIANAGFSMYYANLTALMSKVYVANMGNMLTFGGSVGPVDGPPITAILSPPDAYTVDMKVDDGMPGTGNWMANSAGGGDFGTSTSCTTSSSGTDYTGAYRVSYEGTSCSFFIKSGM